MAMEEEKAGEIMDAVTELGRSKVGPPEVPNFPILRRPGAEALMKDIEELLQRHQSEVGRCVQTWLSRQDDHKRNRQRPPSHELQRLPDEPPKPHRPKPVCSPSRQPSSLSIEKLEAEADRIERQASRVEEQALALSVAMGFCEENKSMACESLPPSKEKRASSPKRPLQDALETIPLNGEGVIPGSPALLQSPRGSDYRTSDENNSPTAAKETRSQYQQKASLTRSKCTQSFVDSNGLSRRRSRTKSRLSWNEMTLLQKVAGSPYYENFSCAVVVLNVISVGWQTQYLALDALQLRPDEVAQVTPMIFILVQAAFNVIFSLDLGIRWNVDGCDMFWYSEERGWNLLDLFVVIVGLLDLVLELVVSGSSGQVGNLSTLRVLRLMRVVRVARIIRVMKFFKELRLMVLSIVGCAKSLLWVVLVLALMLYMFGIAFCGATTVLLTSPDRPKEVEGLIENFGSLDRSVLSLYMAMSGGNDWAEYYNALAPLPLHVHMLFIFFITFAIFAVVNIVTGIFVENATQHSRKDSHLIVQEDLEVKHKHLKSLENLFMRMDEDDSGFMSLEDFERQLEHEDIVAFFHALHLNVSNAKLLFAILDRDGSGEVNIDEFVSGCYSLQGEATVLDSKVMMMEVRLIREATMAVGEGLREMKQVVNWLHAKVDGKEMMDSENSGAMPKAQVP